MASALEINRAILSMESVQTAVSLVTGVKDAYMVNIGLAIKKFSCVCVIEKFYVKVLLHKKFNSMLQVSTRMYK